MTAQQYEAGSSIPSRSGHSPKVARFGPMAGTEISSVLPKDAAVASSLEWLISLTVVGLLAELCATKLLVVRLVRYPDPSVPPF
jgi:hypothetical protein